MTLKKLLIAITAILFTASLAQAGEIKLNFPTAAYHTAKRADGGQWNEFFMDDWALGASYKHDTGLGFSVNQSINSYGENRSVYVTADFLPNVYESGIFKLNVGGHLGFATGYKELNEGSGVIPFIGAGIEAEVANVAFEAVVTPRYKTAPMTFIFVTKFKLWESDKPKNVFNVYGR